MSDFTTDDLTAINLAIKSGTLRVRFADRDVTYRSLEEMKEIRDLIRADLGLVGPDGGRTHRYGSFSKGLE